MKKKRATKSNTKTKTKKTGRPGELTANASANVAATVVDMVDIAGEGTLVEIVDAMAPWMLQGMGEGVVLTIGERESSLRKWKTASEEQGQTPAMLASTMRRLAEAGLAGSVGAGVAGVGGVCGGAAAATAAAVTVDGSCWLDPSIVAMVRTLHAVSVSDEARGVGGGKKGDKKARRKAAREAVEVVLDPVVVEEAYCSALTKYVGGGDEGETDRYFERERRQLRQGENQSD